MSDEYGRAFEFCVASFILIKLKKMYPKRVQETPRTKIAQEKGRLQYDRLPKEKRDSFAKTGAAIAEWLGENKFGVAAIDLSKKSTKTLLGFGAEEAEPPQIDHVVVDRLSDMEGVRGDVTDIRVEFSFSGSAVSVNISLKHMHSALKHPRLTRVPSWIGITDPNKVRSYLSKYEDIWSSFFSKGKATLANATKFRELKAVDSTIIENSLYQPLYELVKDFLQNNILGPEQAECLFDFLVGKYEFVKFIDRDGSVEIRDFAAIPKPKAVAIAYSGSGYLYLSFSNGLKLSGRLHTASEWIRKKSVKFDIQPQNLDEIVPAKHISTISKQL